MGLHEGDRLHAEERGLKRNQTCWRPDLELLLSKTEKSNVCSFSHIVRVVLCYGKKYMASLERHVWKGNVFNHYCTLTHISKFFFLWIIFIVPQMLKYFPAGAGSFTFTNMTLDINILIFNSPCLTDDTTTWRAL